jgi:hypothetical protein
VLGARAVGKERRCLSTRCVVGDYMCKLLDAVDGIGPLLLLWCMCIAHGV